MKNLNQASNRELDGELQRVIEPLASYICATERPRKSLRLALAALYAQIDQTNRTARSHAVAFLEGQFASLA
jgi:hypothetical protein